jgi:cell division protein FtsQ
MARKTSATLQQEEVYPAESPPSGEFEDARLMGLDSQGESPFLRAQKRIPVRRSPLPRKTSAILKWTAICLVAMCLIFVVGQALYGYGKHSWRFRVESGDYIEIAGTHNVSRAQVMEVMGSAIGRNIFFVPLAQMQSQLQQIPWVESASVMRFVPNRLRVEIKERTPEAFVRVGSRIYLIDSSGVLMDLPPGGKSRYSFPVILGANPGEPASTRVARMRIYDRLVRELDSGGAHYSQDLSEVDLSDPDDIKVMAGDSDGEVLVHLGASDFLERYQIYVTHIKEWRQQYAKLESVDLRYDRQIILNPDLRGTVAKAPLTPSAAKSALAAGVKPAALLARDNSKSRQETSGEVTGSSSSKPAAAKPGIPASSRAARPAPESASPANKPSPSIPKDQDHQ